jgi:hypothetical protein
MMGAMWIRRYIRAADVVEVVGVAKIVGYRKFGTRSRLTVSDTAAIPIVTNSFLRTTWLRHCLQPSIKTSNLK